MKGGWFFPAFRWFAVIPWLFPAVLLATSALLSSGILHERSALIGPLENGARTGGLLVDISNRPAFAFGFRNFLADLAWLDAIQAAGSRRMNREDYDRLNLLIGAVNNYDPRFVVPYLLGGMVLGDSQEHVQDALRILERGRRGFPADYRFPFYIGFIQYFALGNPTEGGKALEAAARIPGSPPYFPLLAARMFSEGRAPETALAFLGEMMKQEADTSRRDVLRKRIREVIVERDLQNLERAVEAFKERFGAPPSSLPDLIRSGILRAIPDEPHGGRYVMAPNGEVRSDKVAERLKVFRRQ
jgi:hypothetical protein